ncbi:MAG: 7-carboxy-7-deazaguanine synthase QueE [Candidatus Omnitrophica bacterium]|nr:7-carboxy-7-deazaguanine synthase QueE [Candidatus Omnitrophota bacterium]
MKSKISEIFRSIQGEGKYLGIPQVFIRFYGCNIKCCWCDTQTSLEQEGKSAFKEYLSQDLIRAVLKEAQGVHSVSLTGGEPLLQKDFLKEFLPLLRQNGFSTYLETNGILFSSLEEVIDYIDIVSMDFKLPSSTGQKAFWKEHESFLNIATKKDVFVKCVISLDTTEDDVCFAAKLASKVNRDIVFILQPNTFEMEAGVVDQCQKFQRLCLKYLRDVRVIPQVHKIIGVR